MKKMGVIIICLIFLGLALNYFFMQRKISEGQAAELKLWKQFTPQSGKFKVDLPYEPQYAQEWIAIPHSDKKRLYDTYASEKIDGTLFLINVITYPPEFADSQEVLRENVDELMHGKVGDHLTEIGDRVVQSRPAIDFAFENKDLKGRGRAIQDRNTVYILISSAHKELEHEEYRHFIHSFHIL